MAFNNRYDVFNQQIKDFRGHRGNDLIKHAGIQIEWTPEMLMEFTKCADDPIYFTEKYMKILVKGKGLQPMVLYPYQKDMIIALRDNRFNIFATARQAGKCLVAETTIKVKFLDSIPQKLQVRTLHEVIGCINRYKQHYIEVDLSVLRKQIYTHISQLDKKEARKFDRIWRGASHSAKRLWRDQLSRKYDTERTSKGTQQRECWTKKRILGEETPDSSSWVFRKEKNSGGQGQNFRVNETTLETPRTSRKGVCWSEDIRKIQNSNAEQSYLTRTTKQNDFGETGILQTPSTPFKGDYTNRRTSQENESIPQRKTKERRNKASNERIVGTPKRKFIESFFELGFFVDSDTGFEPVSESHKTIKYQIWNLNTESHSLQCADDHIVFDVLGNEIFVKNLKVGEYIRTENGLEKVTKIESTDQLVHMYDLGIHHYNHRYYTNGILSHNSTVVCAFVLWYMIFNPNKPLICFLANKGKTSIEILKKVKTAYENIPLWLQHGVIEWNKGSIELENGSRAVAEATSSDSVRGYAIDFLFVDEAAFVENWEEFWPSTLNTITSNDTTKCVLVSTPNGLNHFYKYWVSALNKENDFKPIRVSWEKVPGRGEEWYKSALRAVNNDLTKFDQEHNVEFIGSSNTLITSSKLKELIGPPGQWLNPIAELDGVKQYERPEKDRIYVLVADCGEGKGLDFSAFSVFDVTKPPFKQVCTFRSNILTPIEYADVIFNIGTFYNKASVLVELNSIGSQITYILQFEKEYEHMIHTESAGPAGKKVSSGFSNKAFDIGVRTTKSVKGTGCSIAKMLIEQNQLILTDLETIDELSHFSKKGNSWEAEKGNHDDFVMCLVLFGWLSDQTYFKDLTDVNILSKLRDRTEQQVKDELVPFAMIDDGSDQQKAADLLGENKEGWVLDNTNPPVRIYF